MTARGTAAREFKFERWLVALSDRMKGAGLGPRLLYTDKARGDRLAFVVLTSTGLVELLVHRVPRDDAMRGKDGAVLVLLAESRAALGEFAAALGDLHRDTPRLENERRKFYHRVERMAARLLATFELRMKRFPHAALASLSSWVNGATAMAGLEATFRTKEHEADAVRLDAEPDAAFREREARKYLARFAARVERPGGARAAPFVPASNSFRLGFVPAAGKPPAALAVGMAAEQSKAERERQEAADAVDAAEVGVDLAEVGVEVATSGWLDCGGIDLPDCDFVDVPDCGGCDCSF